MRNPEDNQEVDDAQNSEAEDQQSQKDIHSNGYDITPEILQNRQEDIDMLNQAYEASESSYTLGEEDGV